MGKPTTSGNTEQPIETEIGGISRSLGYSNLQRQILESITFNQFATDV